MGRRPAKKRERGTSDGEREPLPLYTFIIHRPAIVQWEGRSTAWRRLQRYCFSKLVPDSPDEIAILPVRPSLTATLFLPLCCRVQTKETERGQVAPGLRGRNARHKPLLRCASLTRLLRHINMHDRKSTTTGFQAQANPKTNSLSLYLFFSISSCKGRRLILIATSPNQRISQHRDQSFTNDNSTSTSADRVTAVICTE